MFYPALTCEEAQTLIEQGAQLVDVRTADEYRHHALPGSVNIPLPVIQRALKQLDKETPVLVYCISGARSGTAKRMLEACGFSRVHNLGSYLFYNNCELTPAITTGYRHASTSTLRS
jgi:phage shock protein E